MTAYEMIDIIMSLNNRIDVQWGMFITVHLALFGGIIYVDRPLRVTEKSAALIIYAGFAVINYMVMNNQVIQVGHIYHDLVSLSDDLCCKSSELIQRMVLEVNNGRLQAIHSILWVVHGLMFVLVVLSIIFDQAISAIASSDTEASDTETGTPEK